MSSQGISTKLTAIIVDDELPGRENLKKIIENYCPEIEIVRCADSVVSAKGFFFVVFIALGRQGHGNVQPVKSQRCPTPQVK